MMHRKYQSNREEGETFLMTKEQIDNFLEDCKSFQNIIDDLKDNPFFNG